MCEKIRDINSLNLVDILFKFHYVYKIINISNGEKCVANLTNWYQINDYTWFVLVLDCYLSKTIGKCVPYNSYCHKLNLKYLGTQLLISNSTKHLCNI